MTQNTNPIQEHSFLLGREKFIKTFDEIIELKLGKKEDLFAMPVTVPV